MPDAFGEKIPVKPFRLSKLITFAGPYEKTFSKITSSLENRYLELNYVVKDVNIPKNIINKGISIV